MVEYQILNSGFFYADGGAMFGAIPKSAWIRKYPCDEKNTCRMAMRCLLVWNEKHVVLLDTGVGTKDLGKLSFYRFHELCDVSLQLNQFGFSPEDVTDVVLSHLHFDHCGGCTFFDETGDLRLTYPNAKHWVGQKQWENYLHPNRLEKHSFRESDMLPVQKAGLLHLIEKDFDLFPGFRMSLYDGHTPGQIVSFIETANGLCVFAGDVIPTSAHFSTDWLSAYDIEPLLSFESKLRLKQEMKKRNGFMVLYHDVSMCSMCLCV
ncbi:MAG: MBL fold metallo-hydrolase [Dysgonamonadaceae bacterium]|jgi:glyoxylase-like metal-dependent hydrolase (beta-lactamase superfamily II)|nr:MBL fold metallo-hydrolase [Dysgonamonadaceae bacterium]